MAFHLIGHSHGGNVINEFTKRAAAMGSDWPSRWKVRSVTYLSTPFFKHMHQVDTTVFDPACRVNNVHCQFDLTQRVVADFSLLPLFLALDHAGLKGVVTAAGAIKLDLGRLQDLLLDSVRNVSVGLEPDWVEWAKGFLLRDPTRIIATHLAAVPLYNELMRLLLAIHEVVSQARGVVKTLQEPLWFPLAQDLQGKVTNTRVLLTPTLAGMFDHELSSLQRGLMQGHARLHARTAANPEHIQTKLVFDDMDVIGDVLGPVASFIALDPNTLAGPLANLIAELLAQQIGEFDNTVRTPDDQLRGTPFASRIVPVDVSENDTYHRWPPAKQNHPRFVQKIEAAERRYENSGHRKDLMDLVFTLLAQDETVRALPKFYAENETLAEVTRQASRLAAALEGALDSAENRLFRALFDLLQSIIHWAEVLRTRDVGGLEFVESVEDPKEGALMYLMKVSHSVSRQDLYPNVKEPFVGQINTRKRRTRK